MLCVRNSHYLLRSDFLKEKDFSLPTLILDVIFASQTLREAISNYLIFSFLIKHRNSPICASIVHMRLFSPSI